MPVGAIGQGIASSFADYIGQERARSRQSEDNQLNEHMSLIKSLSERPDANPQLLGKALHDLVDLQNAKGGKTKLKGGMEGFMGSHELPMSQFLQGIQDGTTPITGPTTELTGSHGVAGMIQPKAMGEMDVPGVGRLSAPMPTPPMPDVPSFGTQPAAHQPLLRSPLEIAQEKGAATGAGKAAEINGLVDSLGGTVTDEEKRQLRRKAMGLPQEHTVNLQTQNYVMPDGHKFSVHFNPGTNQYFDPTTHQPMTLPDGSVHVGTGSSLRFRMITQPDGSTFMIPLDANTGAMGAPMDTGVQGRVQFAPVTTVKGYDPVTGKEITTTIPNAQVPTRPVRNAAPTKVGGGSLGGVSTAGGGKAQPNLGTFGVQAQGTGTAQLTPPPAGMPDMANGPGGMRSFATIKSPTMTDTDKQLVSSLHTSKALAGEIIKYIEENHLQANNNKIDALMGYLPYKLGIDPGKIEQLLQTVGVQEVNQLKGYMNGQRGQYWAEILQQHTAQPSNTYALMYKKAKNMQKYSTELENELNKAMMARPTFSGFQTPGMPDANANAVIPTAPGTDPPVGSTVQYHGETMYFKGRDAQGNKILSRTP